MEEDLFSFVLNTGYSYTNAHRANQKGPQNQIPMLYSNANKCSGLIIIIKTETEAKRYC